MTARTYSTVELVHLAGITYRQIDYWTRAGYLPNPENVTYLGSGYPRAYTQAQVDYCKALARLLDAGLSLKASAGALAEQIVDGQVPEVLRVGGLEIRFVAATEAVAS